MTLLSELQEVGLAVVLLWWLGTQFQCSTEYVRSVEAKRRHRIALLKSNDVEGYAQLVKDCKFKVLAVLRGRNSHTLAFQRVQELLQGTTSFMSSLRDKILRHSSTTSNVNQSLSSNKDELVWSLDLFTKTAPRIESISGLHGTLRDYQVKALQVAASITLLALS